MNVTKGDRLFLVQEESGYHLTAFDPEVAHQLALAEEILKQYRNTLKKLAE